MKIQFHCGAGQFFALKLEGGVFVGQDSPFLVYVGGPTFAPDPPLEVRSDANATMINYVFDLNGHNCPKPPKDNPPDIIIQN